MDKLVLILSYSVAVESTVRSDNQPFTSLSGPTQVYYMFEISARTVDRDIVKFVVKFQ